MAIKSFSAVSFMLLITLKVVVAQEKKSTDHIHTIGNSSGNGSSRIAFNLGDLVRVAQSDSTNNTHEKRQIEYEEYYVLQPYDTLSHQHSKGYPNVKCSCQTVEQQRDDVLHDSTKRTPNCIRRFLVKQLRETNGNINRLLDCISRNDVITNCPIPARISLDLSEEAVYKDCLQSDEHEDPKDSYPHPCESCMYVPDFTGDHTGTKTYAKRMATHEKPSIHRKIHMGPESAEIDTNRFNDAKLFPSDNSCEDESEESKEHTTKSYRRKCKKTAFSTISSTTTRAKKAKKDCRKGSDKC